MKQWYHIGLQLIFGVLILQNILLVLSFLLEFIPPMLPFYMDVIGFSLLVLVLLYYNFVNSVTKWGWVEVLGLLLWLVSRITLQFYLLDTYTVDFSKAESDILNQLQGDAQLFSVILVISAIGLLIYSIFLVTTSETNPSLVIIFTLTNFVATVMVFSSFFFYTQLSFSDRVEKATFGLSVKLLLIPVLAVVAFSHVAKNITGYYPERTHA